MEALTKQSLEAIRDEFTPEEQAAIKRELLIATAQGSDSPESFAAFYELEYGFKLSDKHMTEIRHLYDSKAENRGSLIWSWRGSWKTITLTTTFTAYRIGKEPQKANLIIMANDASAVDTASLIADKVENSAAFRVVFPSIVPDEKRGWGESGYEVKDESISYARWRQKNAHRRDPTILGLGVNSKSLIGKHPDGCLWLDDVHDETNSMTENQRATIVSRIKSTILPFIVEDENENMITWAIAVGTPWEEDDAYHYLKDTGEFNFLKHPVMVKVADEEVAGLGHIYYDGSDYTDLIGTWELTWSDRWSFETVLRWRRRTGKKDFARMYLLNLEASRETGLKYMSFPSEAINYDWRVNSGVDFASVREQAKSKNKNRGYYAQCWGAKVPTGGVVVIGGVFGHFTQAKSEDQIERVQNTFPNFGKTVIESDGKGEEFINLLLRKPSLRIHPMWTQGRKKLDRTDRLGSPLELGILRISDADTPFLNLLRKSLDNYPDGNKDVLDALYWLARSFPEVFVSPDPDDLPGSDGNRHSKKSKNPLYALAKA